MYPEREKRERVLIYNVQSSQRQREQFKTEPNLTDKNSPPACSLVLVHYRVQQLSTQLLLRDKMRRNVESGRIPYYITEP
jgi:hypothetical protein